MPGNISCHGKSEGIFIMVAVAEFLVKEQSPLPLVQNMSDARRRNLMPERCMIDIEE